MTKPLALVFYENLLIGNQVLNKLQELGYRTTLVADLGRLTEQARTEKPLLLVLELALESDRACDAVSVLRRDPETAHVPVLAFAAEELRGRQKRFDEMARGAGISLLADESGLLAQLASLLDRVLAVE